MRPDRCRSLREKVRDVTVMRSRPGAQYCRNIHILKCIRRTASIRWCTALH
jgi:hypothetical protein